MSNTLLGRKPTQNIIAKHIKLLPGIALCFGISVIAYYLGKQFPVVGGAVFGILFGLALRNTLGLPKYMQPGVSFTAKKLLKAAIVVLGAGLSLTQVWNTGVSSLSVMLITLASAYAATFLFGKLLGVPSNLKHMIGTGTAICGASAIAAVSPILEADETEIAYSISTVFLFNVAAVLLFPYLGHLLGLDSSGFGLWAGTAINDTSSVVAAGYIFSDAAGDYATIVKLTRTTMIIPIALLYVAYMANKKKNEAQLSGNSDFSITKIFPWFILLFLGASLLNTSGLFTPEIIETAKWIGKFLIIMALTAVGFQANLPQMFKTGVRPIFLGLIVWFVVATTSLMVQHYVGQL